MWRFGPLTKENQSHAASERRGEEDERKDKPGDHEETEGVGEVLALVCGENTAARLRQRQLELKTDRVGEAMRGRESTYPEHEADGDPERAVAASRQHVLRSIQGAL